MTNLNTLLPTEWVCIATKAYGQPIGLPGWEWLVDADTVKLMRAKRGPIETGQIAMVTRRGADGYELLASAVPTKHRNSFGSNATLFRQQRYMRQFA